MHKIFLAKRLKKYFSVCAKVDKICVQLMDNRRDSAGITQQLYIGSVHTSHNHVGKSWDKAFMLPTITHSQTTAIFRQLTDEWRQLSTLSTPPITTTTNIFNK
ncbi:MAG: hypothetical protein JWP13_243 [Candidatus Saccharibacteria bacterium]|nr:hypothetical protein [Candidatus Saccharibacteria bacterium]